MKPAIELETELTRDQALDAIAAAAVAPGRRVPHRDQVAASPAYYWAKACLLGRTMTYRRTESETARLEAAAKRLGLTP